MKPEVISVVGCASCLSLCVHVRVNEEGLRKAGRKTLTTERYKLKSLAIYIYVCVCLYVYFI